MTDSEERIFYDKVYSALVEKAGAGETMRESFIHAHLTKENTVWGTCGEWRFCGVFGFGGKYRSRTNTIDYYPEDETPELEKLLEEVNSLLKTLS